MHYYNTEVKQPNFVSYIHITYISKKKIRFLLTNTSWVKKLKSVFKKFLGQ